ncbi:MAG TPA: lmo0937 family membrane protein [Vicinamibacterales bacterium]|nr:lmo0937 family membrane protein [Vicinamibacterales bacterium]
MIMFFVILLVLLWILGMVTTYTLGGWLHILLVIAVIFLLIRVIRGEPV